MAGTWRTARVFVSSTFRDMHAERDHLVKVVFPELRERLLPHRVYLNDIDLRWGVTREQTENDQVLDICLQQVDECRPFFLGILGECYGWVPRAIPQAVREHYGWVQYETGKSVTELEILFGVLLKDARMRDRSFFYFRDPRALDRIPVSIKSRIYVEADSDLVAKLAALKDKIRASGYPVMENYPARWDPDAYDRPSKTQGRLVDLDEFGWQVCDQLWTAIKAEFQVPDHPPTFTLEVSPASEADDQERFMESRLRVYAGRDDLQRELIGYALGNDPKPCLVTGPSGSGKSAALARFVSESEQALPGVTVIAHFIGASQSSTALGDVLKRLCAELFEKHLKTEKHIRLAEAQGTSEEAEKRRLSIEQEYVIPEEITPLVSAWREFLRKIPKEHRVVIVLDALNQLEDADRGCELWWLPRDLPVHVKVISSAIVDPCSAEADHDSVASVFRHRPYHPVHVTGLVRADREAVLRKVPSLSAKTLDDFQIHSLLENPSTDNPLYLRVALEELRGFGSYEQLNDRIAALPREGLDDMTVSRAGFSTRAMKQVANPVTALFTQVIERLEAEFSHELVRTVLTLLASARRGLSERELQDLVAGLPKSDDLFPVLRQLRPYLFSRSGLLGFFHTNLLQSVQKYYFTNDDMQRAAHIRLGDYFESQDYWLESLDAQRGRARRFPPTPRPANVRKVDEMLWQRIRAQRWDDIERIVTDLNFLEAKAEAGRVFELATDFSGAVERLSAGHPAHRQMRLIEQALRLDLYFLARHPTALFQCLWSRCCWYDSPEASKHYQRPVSKVSRRRGLWPRLLSLIRCLSSRGWPEGPPPWKRPASDRISTLLEHWLAEKNTRSPGFVWLRSVRPPPFPLGGAELACLRGHTNTVVSVAFSPDGRRLASASRDQTVRVWDAATGAELLCVGGRAHLVTVTGVAFSPDGRRLASGSYDATVRVWDAQTGAELACFRGHTESVVSVAFSPDGRRLASGSYDLTVRVWDAQTGAELACLRGLLNAVRSVAFSPDGRRLVSGGVGPSVGVWEVQTGAELHCDLGHTKRVESVAFSPDGRRLASASRDQTVRVWDAQTGAELACLREHTSDVSSVAFSPDGRRLVSGSGDQTVRIWDVQTGAELACLRGHTDRVFGVAFSPDGRRLASGSEDRTVRVWDAQTGAEPACLRGHTERVVSVAFSPDGRRIVTGSWDRTVRVWDAQTGTELACLRGYAFTTSVAFSPDGRRLASVSSDATVRVWDAQTGAELACFRGHTKSVEGVAFSPDGRRLASASKDRTVRVWDAQTGAELACLRGHTKRVVSVAFSPDSRRLASASKDRTVRVWDAQTGAELACLRGHTERVVSVAFFPDGCRLVSGSRDQTVRVWDAQTSGELACLRVDGGWATSLACSADGRRLASGSYDQTVRVWDAQTGECLEVSERSRDVAALAAGSSSYPYRAKNRDQETVIEPAAGGDPIAWFPAALEQITTHPCGRAWAGLVGDHLQIIQLEGEPGTSQCPVDTRHWLGRNADH